MRASKPAWSLAFCSASWLFAACGGGESASTDTPAPSCPALVEDTLVAPIEPPDGAAACAAGECNYQTQEGCDADQACRPQFNATDVEVHPGCEAAGTATSGDACETQGDCARGYYCALGSCHKFCGFCAKLCAYAMCAEPACTEAEGSCVHFVRDPDGVGECTLSR